MRRSPALLLAAALSSLAGLTGLAGCSIGGGERVGGAPAPHAHELTMLNVFGSGEVTQFTDEVSRLSKGELEIRLVPVASDRTDYEVDVVRRLQDGEADLAVVGTRAGNDFGAPGLAALNAPFLLDSYPLQARVLSGPLVDTIFEGVRPAGLVGIGILPGPIRHPLGLTHALATPEDFRGLTLGTQQSDVADATLRALGATPRRMQLDMSTSSALDGLDGIEYQVTAIESGRLDADGSHLMTNVDLWPRSLVLLAEDGAYDGLSDDERDVLRAAATNAVPKKAEAERGFEAEAAANLCRKGHTAFDAASPEQLRALLRAVQPVYDDLARDPATREVVEAVEDIKAELGEPATEVAACTPAFGATSTGEPTIIDGTWTMDTDRSAAIPEYFDENWGHWVFVFDRGKFAITQENDTSCTWGYGTNALNGSRMALTFLDGGGIAPNAATNRPGEYFVFDLSAYRDTLTLTAVDGEISPLNFRAEPWRRLSTAPSLKHFSSRCPPPRDALSSSGPR
jgi:TRAP-type C4-dicarboxylate transport system substrate-binding protein